MLEGVVPFPPDFARRYREKGYWQDRSLAEEFAAVFDRFKQRIFLVDQNREYTYGEVDWLTDNLALNLLELGLRPLEDRKSTRLNSSHLVISYAVFCLDQKSTRLNSSHLVISYAVFCLNQKSTRLNSSHLVISYAVFCLITKCPGINPRHLVTCATHTS